MNSKIFLTAIAATYFLNFVWENVQAPLYKGYVGFSQNWTACAKAAIGDMVIVGVIFGVMASIFKGHSLQNLSLKHLVPLLLIGSVTAVVVEWWGLRTGRWEYDGMPIIPLLDVGFLPILQMLVIPPVIAYTMKNIYQLKKHQSVS